LFYVAHALLTLFCEKWLLAHYPDDGRFVCSRISSMEADYLCVIGHNIVSKEFLHIAIGSFADQSMSICPFFLS
jgi:hypothetical protein